MIPLSKPSLSEAERQALLRTFDSGWLSFGSQVRAFEEAFASLLNARYAVAVSSGTAGLHLAVHALGLGPGDEVITSPFSFVASANCLLYEGATPVFADVDPLSFNLDPAAVEAAITPRTKAILPVHVFGQCCDMSALMDLAARHGLAVIEDACEAVMASHRGRMAGTFGNMGVFGFYPNKQMTTGEGGMMVTDDEGLYHLLRSLRNQGRGEDGQWLLHERLGFNYRIHELTAALGLVQTGRLPSLIEKRQQVASWYQEALAGAEGILLPATAPGNLHSWFVFGIRVPEDRRDALIDRLATEGIQSKAYFSPCIHLQPFYRERFGFTEGMFPVAERLSREMLILPFYPQLTKDEVNYVAEKIRGIW